MHATAAAAAFGLILACGLTARAQPTPTPSEGAAAAERSNGVMGQFTGAGGDPVLGEKLYQQKCASCHDTPSGRTPAKATIAANTPTFIVSALLEGVMRPMAAGMAPHDIASVAAYLSTRKDGGLDAGALEAPACKDKPAPFSLDGPSWNGWGAALTQDRFQAKPGFKAADAPKLKLKWAFAYAGSRNGQATVAGGRIFLTSASGAVYSLNAKTGCVYWR